MISHFWVMTLFAAFVALVFALLARDEPREQLKFGALLWAAFTVSAVVIGWLMYPLPF